MNRLKINNLKQCSKKGKKNGKKLELPFEFPEWIIYVNIQAMAKLFNEHVVWHEGKFFITYWGTVCGKRAIFMSSLNKMTHTLI